MSTLNFNFNDVEDFKGRIEPGVEECQITGVTSGESQNGKPYIEIGFLTVDGLREHKEKFFVSSEKGTRMTLLRLKHMIKVLVGEEQSKKSYNIDQLNTLFTGVKGRFLFFGEEYEYDNEIRVRTNLAFLNFVEPLKIPKEESKLRYDPNNKNHMKHLPSDLKQKINNKKEDDTKGTGVSDVDEELF